MLTGPSSLTSLVSSPCERPLRHLTFAWLCSECPASGALIVQWNNLLVQVWLGPVCHSQRGYCDGGWPHLPAVVTTVARAACLLPGVVTTVARAACLPLLGTQAGHFYILCPEVTASPSIVHLSLHLTVTPPHYCPVNTNGQLRVSAQSILPALGSNPAKT